MPFEGSYTRISKEYPFAWIFAAVHRKPIQLKTDPFALHEEINHHRMRITFPKSEAGCRNGRTALSARLDGMQRPAFVTIRMVVHQDTHGLRAIKPISMLATTTPLLLAEFDTFLARDGSILFQG
jgi:hypothetical protein